MVPRKLALRHTYMMLNMDELGRFDEAARRLDAVHGIVDSVEPWLRNLVTWKNIYVRDTVATCLRKLMFALFKARFQSLRSSTEECLLAALESSFVWGDSTLYIHANVRGKCVFMSYGFKSRANCSLAGPSVPHQLPLPVILASLQIVMPLEPHVSRITKKLHTRFVDSFLASSSSPRPLVLVVVEDELRLQNMPTSQTPTDGLALFSAFVSDHILGPNLQDTIVSLFQHLLYPPLLQSLIDHHLSPSLPSSLDGLDAYTTVLQRAVEFESSLAWSPETRPVKEWADGVATHWARRRADKAAGTTRRELMGWGDWASETVDYPESNEHWKQQAEPEPQLEGQNENGDVHRSAGTDADHVSDEVEEDGWGFEENEDPAHEERTETVNNGADANDKEDGEGWGFEEEDSQDVETEPAVAASSSLNRGGDPKWGFDPPSSARQGRHRQADSTSGWAWNDEQEAGPPKKGSLSKGKGKSLDEVGSSKLTFSVSTKDRVLLGLAEELLSDSLRISDPT
jgi:hypothetical protein